MSIAENVKRILGELSPGVRLLAVTKGCPPENIREAIAAGAGIIGENYVQEAEIAHNTIKDPVEWHFIGHLQKNKVKKAVFLFDMIETVDSAEIAREIDRRCADINKVMPVLIEINSGREARKSGVLPEDAERLVREIAPLKNIRIDGMMTMGPPSDNPEDSRPCFAETRKTFEHLRRLDLPRVEMKYLSMGMSGSYHVAIEESANIVRIGSKIFGERE